jgi:hypothetical protein
MKQILAAIPGDRQFGETQHLRPGRASLFQGESDDTEIVVPCKRGLIKSGGGNSDTIHAVKPLFLQGYREYRQYCTKHSAKVIAVSAQQLAVSFNTLK